MAHAHTEPTGNLPATPGVWGVLAEFDDPVALIHAAERVRDAGFTRWDVYSPFPVHGMDAAMGLKQSKVTWIMGAAALAGFTSALLMQWWMGAVDFKIVTAGKPLFAWEQATPIMFEFSVLLAAFGAVLGMLALNGLPRWYHPLLKKERFLRVGDDRFCIAIESADPGFDESETRVLLENLGGRHVELVED